MQRRSLFLASGVLHLTLTLLVLGAALHGIGSRFPESPSLLGRAAVALASLLGLPLATGLMYAERFPWFGPAWQSYGVLALNSLLWACVIAGLGRSASCRETGSLVRP